MLQANHILHHCIIWKLYAYSIYKFIRVLSRVISHGMSAKFPPPAALAKCVNPKFNRSPNWGSTPRYFISACALHLLRRRVDLSCFVDLREVFQVDQAWKSAEIKCPMCPISTQMLIRTKPTTLILLRVSMFDWSNFFMLIIFCQRVDSILDIVCIEVSTFLFFLSPLELYSRKSALQLWQSKIARS